jgi:cytochrome c biogenesis protein CcdA
VTDTYADGMAVVIWMIFGLLALGASLEVVCEFKRWPSLSYRIERWSIENPWFSGALILVVGALLAHFVLNPLCPPGSVQCP